ncbi:hypothetical protein B0H14DRAFT_2646238 [Mycena olivaceomarginata]|nr:hypothetical protein B0H14DRAFT_2646238 [Mycena olivaceomarginata]
MDAGEWRLGREARSNRGALPEEAIVHRLGADKEFAMGSASPGRERGRERDGMEQTNKSFDIGSPEGGGRHEHMNTVDVSDIRARSTIVDRASGLNSFHYVIGEGGGELLQVWFVGRVLREAAAGTDQRMQCFHVGFPIASSPLVHMSHMRSLEVLNTVQDREEDVGYTVVRTWVEGDLILVNVSPFTEPHGAGIIEGSLVSFEATLHRHDHRHDAGVQRVDRGYDRPSASAERLLNIPATTMKLRTTFPPDEQLVVYRQGNDKETATTASYVCAGDLLAERVASHILGVHSFVYRIVQAGYPRYYPIYRFGSIGEVHEINHDEQGIVTSFNVRSPSAGTPSAVHHHLETMSVLFYLLEEDSHQKYSEAFTVASTWVDDGGEVKWSLTAKQFLGQIREGAIVAVEATLHRHCMWQYKVKPYNQRLNNATQCKWTLSTWQKLQVPQAIIEWNDKLSKPDAPLIKMARAWPASALDEAVFTIVGALKAKDLPPVKGTKMKIDRLKFARQHATLSRWNAPYFKKALENMQDVAYTMYSEFAENAVEPWRPETADEGEAVISSNCQYFTIGRNIPEQSQTTFHHRTDPHGVLAKYVSDHVAHCVDNDVMYMVYNEDEYTEKDPSTFKTSDLVEMGFAFVAWKKPAFSRTYLNLSLPTNCQSTYAPFPYVARAPRRVMIVRRSRPANLNATSTTRMRTARPTSTQIFSPFSTYATKTLTCWLRIKKLVALPSSLYKLEGPGFLYFPLRGTTTSDIDAFLNGTPLTQAQFDALEIKAGHTAKFERCFSEYRACSCNGPHDHTVVFWVRCYAPERQRTGLLPERLIHLKLKAKRALLAPVPCNGCKKNHREFYSLADAGDLKGFKEIVEEVFLDLGVPFVCTPRPQGVRLKYARFIWEEDSALVYATSALSINRRKGVTERKADAFSVTTSGAEAY